MITPILIILTVFLFLPLLKVLFPSIFAEGYPFSAYVEFFSDGYYRGILYRTVRIAVVTTACCMVLGVPTANFVSRCTKHWRGILLAVAIFPMMTNSVMRSFAWINILGTNGIINRLLLALGVIDEPVKLLYTEFAIVIGSVYLFLPLMIVTVAGVMENIGDDMMEAAESLGANRLTAFLRVIFPMSLPGIELSQALTAQGADEGLFAELDLSKIPNAENLIAPAKELAENGQGIAYTINSVGIVYDREACGMEITSFDDLWDAALEGKIAIPDITATLTYGDTAANARVLDFTFVNAQLESWIDQWNRTLNS